MVKLIGGEGDEYKNNELKCLFLCCELFIKPSLHRNWIHLDDWRLLSTEMG
jgi:hypothetical protein